MKIILSQTKILNWIPRFIFISTLLIIKTNEVNAYPCVDGAGNITGLECSDEPTSSAPVAPAPPPQQTRVAPQPMSRPTYQPVYRPAPKAAHKNAPVVQANTDVSPQEQRTGACSFTYKNESPVPGSYDSNGICQANDQQRTGDCSFTYKNESPVPGSYDSNGICQANDQQRTGDCSFTYKNESPVPGSYDSNGICQANDQQNQKGETTIKDEPTKKAEGNKGADPCVSSASTATNICKGTMAAYATQLSGLNGLMASFDGGNRAQACKIAAEVSKKQAILSAAMAVSCQVAMYRCTSACTIIDPEDPNKSLWEQKRAECDSYHDYVVKNGIAAAAQLATAKASSDCADQVTAAAIPTAPILPIATGPTALDCSNAAYANANALTCYCLANVSDPKCAKGSSAGGSGSHSARSGDNSGGVSGENKPDTGGGGNPTVGAPLGSTAANGGGPSGGGGGGSGGGGLGGGGGVAAAGVAEDAAPPGGAANGGSIFGGFGSGQGGYSYGRGGAGAGDGGGNAASRMFKSLAAKLNLNKIMPKRNDYLNRSVAGMSGSSRDGITGPNGPSIWEKVSRRYQIKKGEMLPP